MKPWPIKHAAAPVRRRGQRDRVWFPGAVVLGERQRRDRLAARDARQQVALGALVRAGEQRVGREHGAGQVRPGEQRRAELLAHQRLLGEAEPGAAVLLPDRDAREPELASRVPPEVQIQAGLRLHELADTGQRCPVGEEAPHGIPQFLLLRADRELHVGSAPLLKEGFIAADGSFGKPSARSPMMPRWISLVPEKIVPARLPRNTFCHPVVG